MSDRLLHGESVSDEQIQAWADEAERSYDLTKLAPQRPGRPPVGSCSGAAITVCSDGQTLYALGERAVPEED